jgi:hypothetical protein
VGKFMGLIRKSANNLDISISYGGHPFRQSRPKAAENKTEFGSNPKGPTFASSSVSIPSRK